METITCNSQLSWPELTSSFRGYTASKTVSPAATKQSFDVFKPEGAQSLAEKLRENVANEAARKEDKKQADAQLGTLLAVKYIVRTKDLVR